MSVLGPDADDADREPHRATAVARSFGADATRYDRARPSYPDVMVRRIVAASPGPQVLDVGCGTGIVAAQFQAAGCTVLGIDVDQRMAELARDNGITVEVAPFEAWEPAGRTFAAVVSGQAWHWIDPDAGAAKAAQALRPAGRVALFWNIQQPPPGLREAFAEVYGRVLPDIPIYRPGVGAYTAILDAASDGLRRNAAFGDPERWSFTWERSYLRDEWLDQVPTFGGHSRLAPATLDQLLAGIGSAIDAVGGRFTMTYAVAVVTARREHRDIECRGAGEFRR